jgi:hypothetical protein
VRPGLGIPMPPGKRAHLPLDTKGPYGCRGQGIDPDRYCAGRHIRDVSAEAPCAEFHKPFPRKRSTQLRQAFPRKRALMPDVNLCCLGYRLRRETWSDSAMWSAWTARSPAARLSRACRSSLRELVRWRAPDQATCSSMRWVCRAAATSSAAFSESVRLVAVTRIKVVRVGIHLVLDDAVRSSARCTAHDEHAPTGHINPDGISLVGGSFGDSPTRSAAGSSPVLPTHHGHLQATYGYPTHACTASLP